MNAPMTPPKKRSSSEQEKKWSRKLMDAGYVTFPEVLLERQMDLGIDSVDLNIILHIVRHWWTKDRLPFPSKRTIAKRIGCSESTVQKHIAKLEKSGLINRNSRYDIIDGGQKSNFYDFQNLINKATAYAEEMIKEKKSKKAKKQQ